MGSHGEGRWTSYDTPNSISFPGQAPESHELALVTNSFACTASLAACSETLTNSFKRCTSLPYWETAQDQLGVMNLIGCSFERGAAASRGSI